MPYETITANIRLFQKTQIARRSTYTDASTRLIAVLTWYYLFTTMFLTINIGGTITGTGSNRVGTYVVNRLGNSSANMSA